MIEPGLQGPVEAALARALGGRPRVRGARGVGGGCIHRARRLELDGGATAFLKSCDGPSGVFLREAEGLRALAAPGVLRVPEVLAAEQGTADSPAFLLLETVETGSPPVGFFRDFGRRLAELHRRATADRFGFEHDNYLGATPQKNPWTASWTEFWAEQRLGDQLRLARQNSVSDPELEGLGDRLLARLPSLLDPVDEPPSLLHGDLWSGNFMVDHEGEPVLVDPAAYYGHREAELAMTRLFGGFDRDFYRAYEEAWPLAPGSAERLDLYELHHLLNHLNLFGRGYRSQCLAVLRRLV